MRRTAKWRDARRGGPRSLSRAYRRAVGCRSAFAFSNRWARNEVGKIKNDDLRAAIVALSRGGYGNGI